MFKKIITSSIIALVGIVGFLGNIQIQEGKSAIIGVNSTFAEVRDDCGGANPPATCPASASPQGVNKDEVLRKTYDGVVSGLNIILSLLTIIIAPAIMFASWLMSPDWTTGELFGLRAIMHSLWITVSNITYFIYAILLIFIAIATIFNSDHYGYKQLLPRLAVGILLVPLTWWFVGFIISTSAVLTVSIIKAPQEAMFQLDAAKCQGDSEKCWENRATIPKNIPFYNVSTDDSAMKKSYEDSTKAKASGSQCTKADCYTPKEFLTNVSGTYGHLLVYAYSVFKISEVKVLPSGVDHLKSALEIVHQGFIGTIMFIVFGLLILALTFMLLTRAIKLWFYAIFSPLFTLRYVIGDGFSKIDKDGSLNVTEFIALAFTPAVIGLALSFGLVVVGALQSGDTSPGSPTCTAQQLEKPEGCLIKGIMGNDKNKIIRRLEPNGNSSPSGSNDFTTVNEIIIGGITFTFYGNPGSPDDVAKDVNSATGVLSSAGGMIGRIIIDIIALVFIWVAFMAAAGLSKAAGKAIEPFKQMGEKIGSMGAKLPQYAPIPGLGMSINSMGRAAGDIEHLIQKSANDKYEKSAVGKMLHADLNIPETEASKLRDAIKNGNRTEFERLKKEYGGRQNGYDSHVPEAMHDKLKELGSQENQRAHLRHLGYDTQAQDKMIKFMQENPNGINNSDTLKKELWGYIANSQTTADGGAGGSNPAYTIKPSNIVKDKLTMNLGGTSINIDKIDSTMLPEKVADMISKEIKGKIDDFKKNPINKEDLEKLLNSEGLKGTEIIKELLTKVPDGFGKKPSEGS